MKKYIALSLLLCSCMDIAEAQTSTSAECPSFSSRTLEAQIQDALDDSNLNNVGVLIERDDGRRVWMIKGTPNLRYISSSTAKPVMMAVALDLVDRRILNLRTKVVDVLPAWNASAVGMQRDIEVRHLLSMTSGIVQGPACWNTRDLATYSACVDSLPSVNTEREPGVRFHYSTIHLDVLSHVVATITGQTWEQVFDDWRTRTGLFPGVTWNRAFVAVASRELNITAEEYMDFLNAIDQCSILSPRLCALMQQDQHSWTTEINSLMWPLILPDGSRLNEDWRFGFGLWMECRAAEWSCPYTHRVSSYGVAGQYALIERQHRYRFVITPSFGPNAGARGFLFERSVENILQQWSSLSR